MAEPASRIQRHWISVLTGTLILLMTASGCQQPPAATTDLHTFLAAAPKPATASRSRTHRPSTSPAPAPVTWITHAPDAPHAPDNDHQTPPTHRVSIEPHHRPAPSSTAPNTTPPHPGPATDQPQPLPMFFVFGEVRKPGPYRHTGRNRVLDIMAQVQPTRAADPSRVHLVRHTGTGQPRTLLIDVDLLIRGGDRSRNLVLQPGDILYVPASTPARIGQAISSFFAPTQPAGPARTSSSRR